MWRFRVELPRAELHAMVPEPLTHSPTRFSRTSGLPASSMEARRRKDERQLHATESTDDGAYHNVALDFGTATRCYTRPLTQPLELSERSELPAIVPGPLLPHENHVQRERVERTSRRVHGAGVPTTRRVRKRSRKLAPFRHIIQLYRKYYRVVSWELTPITCPAVQSVRTVTVGTLSRCPKFLNR
jgi:hypothetical protein